MYKYTHPPRYVVAALICGIGGLINGMDTSTIGPVTSMPSFSKSFGHLSAALHGIVVSSVLLSGGVSCIFSGHISDTAGRLRSIVLGALLFATGAAIEAAAVNLGMFIAGRLVVGTGEGLLFSVSCVYICEIAPPQHRGVLASIPQAFVTLGLCVGYFASYGTVNIPSSLSWRLPLALQSGFALALAGGSFFFVPESPRFLSAKGRKEESIAVWDKLGVLAAEREKVEEADPDGLQAIVDSDAVLPASANKRSWKEGIREFLKVFGKDSRKQMALGVFLMGMQQFSGIDGVLFYAPTLFQQAGLSSSESSFLASGISAIVIAVCTIPAFLLVDKWGRRASTIIGGMAVASCMLLIGSLYASNSVHQNSGIGRWVVVVTIYIFAIAYAVSWAIGVRIFANEIQPAATRATATSLAQGSNFVTNFIVALTTPIFLARSAYGVYFLFGGCSLVTVGVCLLYMPETQGRSLEAIEESFRNHTVADVALIKQLSKLARRINNAWSRFSARNSSSHEQISENLELSGTPAPVMLSH